jgi:predicted porin
VIQDRTNRGWGWVLQGALTYKASYGNAKLSLSHNLVPAGGQRGVTNRSGVFLDLSYRFTYEFSGTFATSYIRNKADRGEFGTLGIDADTFYIIPGVRYEFTRDIVVSATYNFLQYKDKIARTTADRNLFLVQLRMQHSLFD